MTIMFSMITIIILHEVRNYIASEAPSGETQANQPLNFPISFHEVKYHVFKAKKGKAISVDGIPNEVLKTQCP